MLFGTGCRASGIYFRPIGRTQTVYEVGGQGWHQKTTFTPVHRFGIHGVQNEPLPASMAEPVVRVPRSESVNSWNGGYVYRGQGTDVNSYYTTDQYGREGVITTTHEWSHQSAVTYPPIPPALNYHVDPNGPRPSYVERGFGISLPRLPHIGGHRRK